MHNQKVVAVGSNPTPQKIAQSIKENRMRNQKTMTFKLDTTPPRYATFPWQEGRVFALIVNSGGAGINTLQLQQHECLNPSSTIAKLRKKGVQITSILDDVFDSQGELRPQVARYIAAPWYSVALAKRPQPNKSYLQEVIARWTSKRSQ